MFFITPCPICRRKIRFPLNKGKIKVLCACGHSFIADPDNPELYKKGKFDLKNKSRQREIFNINMKDIKLKLINRFLDTKYKIQNFKLLPTAEQRKIILFTILFIIIIFIIIYL